MLVQIQNCLLFVPNGEMGVRLMLAHYRQFGSGDTVCVQGILRPDHPGMCQQATGFLADNSITGSTNPQQPFNGCGVLVQIGSCLLFAPGGTDSAQLLLENYGSFGAGDSVCVHGMLVLGQPALCPMAFGTIVDNTIDGCNTPNPPYSACGVLAQMGPCLLFIPEGFDSLQLVLQNYGGFGPGAAVCVQGTIAPGHPSFCPPTSAMLINNTIIPANSGSPSNLHDGTLEARNYPNPFNPVTNIQFDLPQTGQVTISVYNSLGQAVKILADRVMSAGNQQVSWDGTDLSGRSVASGIYFYRIEFNGISETRKMLLMK